MYAGEVRRKKVHATRKSKIFVSQMFSDKLTQQNVNALKRREDRKCYNSQTT